MSNKTAEISHNSSIISGQTFSLEEKSDAEQRTGNVFKQILQERLSQENLLQSHGQEVLSTEVMVSIGNDPVLHVCSKGLVPDTQFMIGSVSKQFFAASLLKALYEHADGKNEIQKVAQVEERLQIPISHFLPEGSPIWGKNLIPSWAKEVTLHQLLTHTSGIPNYMDVSLELKDWNQTGKKFHELPHSAAEVIDLISNVKHLERDKFSYSNTNYRIISEVIEAVTKIPASVYVEKALFVPLQMTSTLSPTGGTSDILRQKSNCNRLAQEIAYNPFIGFGHKQTPNFHEDIGVAIGDGSIISTAKDLLKWNLALHRDQTVLPKALYQRFVTKHVQADPSESYCYGIAKKEDGTFLHGGHISAYKTVLQYLPKYSVSIIAMTSNECHCSESEDQKAHKEIEEELIAQGSYINKEILEEKTRERIQKLHPNHFARIDKILNRVFLNTNLSFLD